MNGMPSADHRSLKYETPEKKSCHRILVIDDNTAIHEDFQKILVKQTETDNELEGMESLLFGSEASHKEDDEVRFELDYATQGQEGLKMVRQANEAGNPFALAFVDGRMPPGWDGIETISHLWEACPELQVVLCTAYADYSWQEIQNVLGKSDSLLILKKPFDNMEVLQMAHALTRKWELNREIKGRLRRLAFVCGVDSGMSDRSIIGAIMAMAQGMEIRVIAEGVDNNEQIDFLMAKQCREAQGFYFSRPLPAQKMEELLQKGNLKIKS